MTEGDQPIPLNSQIRSSEGATAHEKHGYSMSVDARLAHEQAGVDADSNSSVEEGGETTQPTVAAGRMPKGMIDYQPTIDGGAEDGPTGEKADGLPTSLDEFIDLYNTFKSHDQNDTAYFMMEDNVHNEQWCQEHPGTLFAIVDRFAGSDDPLQRQSAANIANIVYKVDKDKGLELLARLADDTDPEVLSSLETTIEMMDHLVFTDDTTLEEALPFLRIQAKLLKSRD